MPDLFRGGAIFTEITQCMAPGQVNKVSGEETPPFAVGHGGPIKTQPLPRHGFKSGQQQNNKS